MIKNAMVLGIGKWNYNYKKIIGFVNALSKIYETIHVGENIEDDGNVETINRIIKERKIDLVFGETLKILHINFENVKMCFMWGDEEYEAFKDLTSRFPKTKFIYGEKSVLYKHEASELFIRKYGEESLNRDRYTKRYLDVISALKDSEKIDDEGTYKITDNFYVMYVPCCISELGTLDETQYDVCYFGTAHNRPNVLKTLQTLRDLGYSIKSNVFDGHIDPEDCIKYYSQTICTLHEQIFPVDLEFPVRMGESSANGCKVFSFDNIGLKNKNLPDFLPDYEIIDDNINPLIDYIQKVKNDNSIREHFFSEFKYTYDFTVERIHRTFNKM